MYRVEFVKKNLEAQDVEIGRVVVTEDGSTKGTLYGEGTTFSTKESAEEAGEKFKEIFKPYPNSYEVKTEIYKVRD